MNFFQYDHFGGLITNWLWFDKIMCRVFGHPQRRYYANIFNRPDFNPMCARCLKEVPVERGK